MAFLYFKLFTVLFILALWPLSFLLKNGLLEFVYYGLPMLFILLGFLLFIKKNTYWPLILMPIGIINDALLFFPFLVTLLNFIFLSRTKLSLFLLLLSMVVIVFGFSNFSPKSILIYHYQEQQSVIREGQLYPTVWLARLFQNKPGIYLDQYKFNLSALTDPNNYFFGFHPREIVENQNLTKFPFLSIIFFLLGIYYFRENIHWKFIAITASALIFSLSLLTHFDKVDFVLFLPLSLLILTGVKSFIKNLNIIKIIFLGIFLFFGFLEYLQLFTRSLLGNL